jgi:hypothetical protein
MSKEGEKMGENADPLKQKGKRLREGFHREVGFDDTGWERG